ncbi:MAG: TetR/AcrR family transcriptional regulator [Jatrophihabitans sp.]|uniref:TetR/AcrR family transcriptional regulator n=1 Tax=Jatrophihabitans sp. TaxID=1932789 RepID=UPI0039115509
MSCAFVADSNRAIQVSASAMSINPPSVTVVRIRYNTMDLIGTVVKSSRQYDSSRRQRQAELARERILAAARTRFLAAGYAATTVAAVAVDADVSVETIYKNFGGKPGLVRALWERALAGRGPVPAPVRSDAMSEVEADAEQMLRKWAKLAAEVSFLGAPIMLLVRAAATGDEAMATLLAEAEQERLTRMRHNAKRLLRTGGVRPGLGLAQVTDVLWMFSAAEQYELLVLRRNWTRSRYAAFVGDAMVAALL